MCKNVILVLNQSSDEVYGEYANVPVFDADCNIIGYTGGTIEGSGLPCEYNAINDEGFPVCNSSAKVLKLRWENAELREQMERLVTLLRVDYDIEASWDGLRKFWSISLTKGGCLMRDRACKAEAENAKLRELCADMFEDCVDECDKWRYVGCMRELGIEVDE